MDPYCVSRCYLCKSEVSGNKRGAKTSTLSHLEEAFMQSDFPLKVMGCAQGPSLAVSGFELPTLQLVA